MTHGASPTYFLLLVNKLLIVSGETTKTELWPKPGPQCALPDFPLQISSAVGIWTAQGPMVCGGSGGGIGKLAEAQPQRSDLMDSDSALH